jgi:predicted dehydrogenase
MIAYFSREVAPSVSEELTSYTGWKSESGWNVNTKKVSEEIIKTAKSIEEIDVPTNSLKKGKGSQNIKEVANKNKKCDHLEASLFGLGNYAKTTIIPNLKNEIEVSHIHEVDPLQIGDPSGWECTVDTSEKARPDERPDIYLIAGYHHTHAPLALKALSEGAWAVVEKPICTTRNQYEKLKREISENSKLFSCFHKRYSELNEFAFEDLNVSPGDPIHYHCIVYEIPLPPLHWYNWPVSGSRIVSNGCHWLDHFLYLNDYTSVEKFSVEKAENNDVAVNIELRNGAFFSMAITDVGSSRLGTRDYVELRAGDTTVKMKDNSNYKSENEKGVIRSEKANRRSSYSRMYNKISNSIIKGDKGDSVKTLRSTRLMLDIEKKVRENE